MDEPLKEGTVIKGGINTPPTQPKPAVKPAGQGLHGMLCGCTSQLITLEDLRRGGLITIRSSKGVTQSVFTSFRGMVKQLGFHGAIMILDQDQTVEMVSEEAQLTIYRTLAKKFEGRGKPDGADS